MTIKVFVGNDDDDAEFFLRLPVNNLQCNFSNGVRLWEYKYMNIIENNGESKFET